MRVAELMITDVKTVTPAMPAFEAWALMKREGIRHMVVMDGREGMGVLSEREARRAFGVW